MVSIKIHNRYYTDHKEHFSEWLEPFGFTDVRCERKLPQLYWWDCVAEREGKLFMIEIKEDYLCQHSDNIAVELGTIKRSIFFPKEFICDYYLFVCPPADLYLIETVRLKPVFREPFKWRLVSGRKARGGEFAVQIMLVPRQWIAARSEHQTADLSFLQRLDGGSYFNTVPDETVQNDHEPVELNS